MPLPLTRFCAQSENSRRQAAVRLRKCFMAAGRMCQPLALRCSDPRKSRCPFQVFTLPWVSWQGKRGPQAPPGFPGHCSRSARKAPLLACRSGRSCAYARMRCSWPGLRTFFRSDSLTFS
eukprot:10122484-Lingulodinium_polyedra.AAC.1